MKNLFSDQAALKKIYKAKSLLLMLDFDGTLAPIAPTPAQAKIDQKAKLTLKNLSKQKNIQVAIISGRKLSDLKNKIGIKDLEGNVIIKEQTIVATSKDDYISDAKDLLSREDFGEIREKYKNVPIASRFVPYYQYSIANEEGITFLDKDLYRTSRSEDFLNLLETSDPEMIPNKQQLKDLWFLIDYKLNYEKILKIDDPIKLRKLELQLEDICNRIAPDSAIAHLFSGIIAKKLGNIGFARLRADQTSLIINGDGTDNNKGSAYWKNRFNVLDLYYLLDDLRK